MQQNSLPRNRSLAPPSFFWIFSALLLWTHLSVPTQGFGAPKVSGPPKPQRLLFLVFDAMRPDYIDRFQLKNFKALRSASVHQKDGWVGHLASETVVSHAVMATGLKPKHLPWSDDIFVDEKNLLGHGIKNYDAGDLKLDQFMTLMNHAGAQNWLSANLAKKWPERKTYAVGAKTYAPTVFGGPQISSMVTFHKKDGICRPAGHQVPDYISGDERFTVDCKKRYGTENSFYSWDGSRHIPGDDPAHQGGDIWVADIAMKIMDHDPTWSAMFLTFSGIDKISHMLGEHDGPRAHDFKPTFTFEEILRVADAQLGRLIAELKRRQMWDSTMIVLTADHGGQGNQHYYGGGWGKALWGELENQKIDLQDLAGYPVWTQKLIRTAPVRMLFQDSAIRVWLTEHTAEAKAKALVQLEQTCDITEVYERVDDGQGHYSYRLASRPFWNRQPKAFKAWAERTSALLMDSWASSISPDFVGLAADDAGFGLLGDHGGAQEKVQRIPMLLRVPNGSGRWKPGQSRSGLFGLSDIAPVVREQMAL